MRTTLVLTLVALATLLPFATLAPALAPLPTPPAGPGTFNFEIVGHDPLFGRGMNAAPAIYGDHVYVGSRTDGQPHHPHPGILVVDVSDPTTPTVVSEIGPPHAGTIGMTSRELRVWHEQGILIVMNFGCSSLIHACTGDVVTYERANFKFFDLKADPLHPPLLASWTSVDRNNTRRVPHEMFLWVDPAKPAERALMYVTSPSAPAALIVADISDVRSGVVTVVGDWGAHRDEGLDETRFTPFVWAPHLGENVLTEGDRAILHSLSVEPDGMVGHVAYQGAGYVAIDTSDFALDVPDPKVRLVTPLANRVDYSPILPPEVHTAIKVPGADVVMLTDEVYAFVPGLIPDGGCPWGWVHFVDVEDPAAPKLVGEYKVAQNDPAFCPTADGARPLTSYTSHNPTVLGDVAFVTWHAAGLQAFKPNPNDPTQLGAFYPTPLTVVATEDPALGGHPVAVWSYPIIKDGLIYVIDLRNGLYVLRYTGPGHEVVDGIAFLEGNSNAGDAGRLEAGL